MSKVVAEMPLVSAHAATISAAVFVMHSQRTYVGVAIFVAKRAYAEPILPSLDKRANVLVPGGPRENALPIRLVINPVALISVARGPDTDPLSMALTVGVREGDAVLVVVKHCEIFASIVSPVRVCILAATVRSTFEKLSFVSVGERG